MLLPSCTLIPVQTEADKLERMQREKEGLIIIIKYELINYQIDLTCKMLPISCWKTTNVML